MGGAEYRLSDREHIPCGGLPFFDIDEEMSWDAVAIHGEDPIGLSQGSLECLLCFATV